MSFARIPLMMLATLTPLGSLLADDPPLAEAFGAEVEAIAEEPLLGIDDPETWKDRRAELQGQLREMLGLEPLPERTPMAVEVREVVDRPDFVVEAILYQSSPGLYVTGNLYRPKVVTEPLPAILYVCGHAGVERDGIIYGCKAHYQHHAAWYAANGYVCFVVDTLQLGEVPGLHHGTYREGRWWWQSRGYTPAGVEVWNGMRAIDYLTSRPEVDPDRIGVTGRSGGGAISWYLGALDDRLAAVIPVAGITDLRNHVLAGAPEGPHPDGVIEGHCDCMYFVNTYRWDFDTLAALVAPKPLLIENTDADPIFPIDGVRRIYDRLETVYDWYDAEDRLGLVVGGGGHVDSEEIRYPSFAFMNTWLKGEPTDPTEIVEPDRAVPIEDLKVLEIGEHLDDARNGTIDEIFVPRPAALAPITEAEWRALQDRWMKGLRTEVFSGWPNEGEAVALNPGIAFERAVPELDLRVRAIDYDTQFGVRLRAYVAWPSRCEVPGFPALAIVAGEDSWDRLGPWVDLLEGEADDRETSALIRRAEAFRDDLDRDESPRDEPFLATLAVSGLAEPGTVAIVVPRGIGPTGWDDGREDTQIRRRFALLGQTLGGMRVWDIRRGLRALMAVGDWTTEPNRDHRFELTGQGDAAALALWASVFEPQRIVSHVAMVDPPATVREGPALLNLERVLDMPQAVTLLAPRGVSITTEVPEAFSWATQADSAIGRTAGWDLHVAPSP